VTLLSSVSVALILPDQGTIMANTLLYLLLDDDTILTQAGTIMTGRAAIENDLRDRRNRLGWSQQDLALRSGLSRTGIGAIESGRLVPSTAAALSLASALGCRVEDLFRLPRAEVADSGWAWPPRGDSGRFWQAEVDGQTRLYPVEASPLGVIPHDGTFRGGDPLEGRRSADPSKTLVLASCDPAVGLLAAELARSSGVRLITFGRSSRAALKLLASGAVHAAGVHLSSDHDPDGNASAVRGSVGSGFTLLRVARWEEGIASSPARKLTSSRDALKSKFRWVGRESGSGARQCQDELLDGQRPPRQSASDHRGVAEAIRSGWAEVGVCLRLAAEEAGLDFLGVREEAYDIGFPKPWEADPRIRALVAAVQSPGYRRSLRELPGYTDSDTGELRQVIS
jgi:molybdate-binding protein/DNA-binding XRE family transcriptional regulator